MSKSTPNTTLYKQFNSLSEIPVTIDEATGFHSVVIPQGFVLYAATMIDNKYIPLKDLASRPMYLSTANVAYKYLLNKVISRIDDKDCGSKTYDKLLKDITSSWKIDIRAYRATTDIKLFYTMSQKNCKMLDELIAGGSLNADELNKNKLALVAMKYNMNYSDVANDIKNIKSDNVYTRCMEKYDAVYSRKAFIDSIGYPIMYPMKECSCGAGVDSLMRIDHPKYNDQLLNVVTKYTNFDGVYDPSTFTLYSPNFIHDHGIMINTKRLDGTVLLDETNDAYSTVDAKYRVDLLKDLSTKIIKNKLSVCINPMYTSEYLTFYDAKVTDDTSLTRVLSTDLGYFNYVSSHFDAYKVSVFKS